MNDKRVVAFRTAITHMASYIDNRQRSQARTIPAITDAKGKTLFDSALEKALNAEAATRAYADCETKRLGTGWEQHETAYTYLALGFKMAADPKIVERRPHQVLANC